MLNTDVKRLLRHLSGPAYHVFILIVGDEMINDAITVADVLSRARFQEAMGPQIDSWSE